MHVGEAIEAFWPDDDEWLPASVVAVSADGSLRIAWAADGSESDVPSEYVRQAGVPDDDSELQWVDDSVVAQPSGLSADEEPELQWVEDADADAAVEVECDKLRKAEVERHQREARAPPPVNGGLARHRGAQRDTKPAWMTKGVGIGTEMFGESTGELLKPGLTRKDLERLEKTTCKDLGSDPFGLVFCESQSGNAAINNLAPTGPHEATATPKPPPPPRRRNHSGNFSVEAGSYTIPAVAELGEPGPPCFEHETSMSFSANVLAVVDLPYAEAQNPAGSFSVDFWVQPCSGSGYRSPLTSRDFPPPRGYAFFLTPRGRWAFWVGIPGCGEWTKVEGSNVQENEWQRLTGTYCSNSQTVRLLVDGIEVGSRRAPGDFEPNKCQPLRLGAGASEASAKFPFQGALRKIRIYNHALQPPLPAEGPPSKRRR